MAFKGPRKIAKIGETMEVIYDEERWKLLRELREEAIKMMESLRKYRISSIVHGSIARGDVKKTSDIDVFIQDPPPSYMIELALESSGFEVLKRYIIQATPFYAVKGYIEVGDNRTVSFPLAKMRKIEVEFYKFGGEIDLMGLKRGKRVIGVDKRLMLIEPTERGHVESSILGRESEVARMLRISVDTVLDRSKALRKRDRVGRTGVFLKRELAPSEEFEAVLFEICSKNPIVRKRVLIG